MEIDKDDMGAVPAAIVTMPGRVRGNHPLDSFTAVGPRANELISEQGPLNVYAPLQALAKADGSVVLIGVGLDKMTLLHLAEQKAGRNLFIRWANGRDRQPMVVEAGGCSDGFVNFESILSPLMKQAEIGGSVWRVYPARAVLEVAARAIRENAQLTHCSDPQCERCNDAILGGPIISD
jgi:aminoglycoside 3-N-acetyltransferase